MERKYEVGAHIKYIDSHRKAHDALVLIWWMPKDVPDYAGPTGEPGCNLVLVDPDPKKDDSYGRQILRETSMVHLSNNPGGGNCWCWPDEV
jgi:hypothetical protein